MTDTPGMGKQALDTNPGTELLKAKELLRKEREERLKTCWSEVQVVLKKYGCQMHVPKPELQVVIVDEELKG